jgi:hypothetical protein
LQRSKDRLYIERVASSPSDKKRADHVWVLDTETKGTGANMVPLERVLRKGSDRVPGFTLPPRRRGDEPEPEPHKPHRFRIVDLMTGRVLADDVEARQALEALEGVRSIVDVTIFVWDEDGETWRRLTFGEARALWDLRGELRSENAPARSVN